MGRLSPAELTPIRGRLKAFAADLFGSLARTDQRACGRCYLRGLLLDRRRRSIEPMAARLGQHGQLMPLGVGAVGEAVEAQR